jgi:hypothetical protein
MVGIHVVQTVVALVVWALACNASFAPSCVPASTRGDATNKTTNATIRQE